MAHEPVGHGLKTFLKGGIGKVMNWFSLVIRKK